MTGHHAFFKSLDSINSILPKEFDIGQTPTDMARFTEGGMRMFGTLLLDEKNHIKSEPLDNLFTEIYMNELQVTNIDQVSFRFLFCFIHYSS